MNPKTESESAEMKTKLVDLRIDQMEFLKGYRAKTGIAANHFIRVAIDREIERVNTKKTGSNEL
jgi:hypothetical protein